MQIRVLWILATMWLWTAVTGCAAHQVNLSLTVHRAPELSLERFGSSVGLTVDGSENIRSIVEPEFARLTGARRVGPAVVSAQHADLLLAVDQLRETYSEQPTTHTDTVITIRRNGTNSTEQRITYGTERTYSLAFRWSIVRRTTMRPLASRTWETSASSDSAVLARLGLDDDGPIRVVRSAWLQAARFLALVVSDSQRQESGWLTDCEGRCGDGYEAMLAGRLLEAETHFRAAEQQFASDDVSSAAVAVWRNLAACLEFQGRVQAAAIYRERAWQADRDGTFGGHIGGLRIEDEVQLRAARRELATMP